jgi:phage tail protein X
MTEPQFPDFSAAPTGEVRAVLAQLDRMLDHLAADINRYARQRGVLEAELEARPGELTDDELERMAARLGRRLDDMAADHPERDEVMRRVEQLSDEVAERRRSGRRHKQMAGARRDRKRPHRGDINPAVGECPAVSAAVSASR